MMLRSCTGRILVLQKVNKYRYHMVRCLGAPQQEMPLSLNIA
jgi:hypothetical protein